MPDRDRVGRFLRTLLGLLTVAWVVVAVVTPPDLYVFTLWLVPTWVLALLATVAMELADGYSRLRNSRFYAPGVEASTATMVFVALTLVLKAVFTLAADFVLGAANVGDAEGATVGILALFVAYVFVFMVGVVGWVRNGTSAA